MIFLVGLRLYRVLRVHVARIVSCPANGSRRTIGYRRCGTDCRWPRVLRRRAFSFSRATFWRCDSDDWDRMYERLLLPVRRLSQLVLFHATAVLLDQAPVTFLAREFRVDLEHLHRLAGLAARTVDFVLGASFDVRVAALTLLVGREVFFDLGGESVVVGEWWLLCQGRGSQDQRENERAHRTIIAPRRHDRNPFCGSRC